MHESKAGLSHPLTGARVDPDSLVLTIARFRSRFRPQGTAQQIAWPQWRAELQRHGTRSEKDGSGWTPCAYKVDPPYRKAANVTAVCALLLDIEDGTTLEELRPTLGPYEWVAYSTHSSTPENPRFRVVLPLAVPVPAELWKRWWLAATARLVDGRVDTSCKDPARLFYDPCHLPKRLVTYDPWSVHNAGVVLHPDEIELPPPDTKPFARSTTLRPGKQYGSGDYSTLDVVGWFAAHGHYGKHLEDNKHAVRCPWMKEHTKPTEAEDSDTVVWEAEGGWPGFFCSHHHCEGRGIRSVMELWPDADAFCARDFVPIPANGNGHQAQASSKPAEDIDALLDAEADRAAEAESARRAPSRKAGGAAEPLHREDLDNGVRFARQHGKDVRYCWTSKTWFVWTGKRWQEDGDGEVQRLAKQTARSILREAAEASSDEESRQLQRWAYASRSNKRIQAMLAMASSEPGIGIQAGDFDQQPHLLNTQSGTLDLDTLKLYPHRREDLLTKITAVPYAVEAVDPILEEVLDTATCRDSDLRGFIEKAFGSVIRGGNPDDKVYVIHGPTRTAKGTFVNAVAAALGDYALNVAFETFLARKDIGRARPDVARLAGARFVYCSENDRGTKLAEALIKNISGNDKVTARFLFKNEFEFLPEFKPFLVCNHLPDASHDDDALWERLVRIPFEHYIPEEQRKPAYRDHLANPKGGGPALLALLVRGYARWRKEGLGVPKVIRDATAAYREEQDPLREFYADCCCFDRKARATAKQLYEAYLKWARSNGQTAVTQTAFGRELRKKGCTNAKDSGLMVWSGIAVLIEDESPPDPRMMDD